MIRYLNHIQGKNCHLCVSKHSNTWVQSLRTFEKHALQCDGLQYYENMIYDRFAHFKAFHSMVSTITLKPFLINLMKMPKHGRIRRRAWQNVIFSRACRKPSNNKLMLSWKIIGLGFKTNCAWSVAWNGTSLGGI
jgi:hypothetical protein